ncbi:MAG: hypothetical protein LBO66_05620 [Deltaproteobacteria bacterium]|nr:hypothetical protein [Deltaproteobacteria bacterium]
MTIALLAVLTVVLGLTLFSRVCRADGSDLMARVGSFSPSENAFRKKLFNLDCAPTLQFLGVDPAIAIGSEPVDVEPVQLESETRIIGRAYRLGDDEFLIVEIPFSTNHFDLILFLLHCVSAVSQFSDDETDAKVAVMTVYPADIEERPTPDYPRKEGRDERCLKFHVWQVFLEDIVDLGRLTRELEPAVKDWKSGGAAFKLDPLKRVELFLAPLGKIQDEKPSELIQRFIRLAGDLAAMTGDHDIFVTPLLGLLARSDLAAAEARETVRKEFKTTDIRVVKLMDALKDGELPSSEEELPARLWRG